MDWILIEKELWIVDGVVKNTQILEVYAWGNSLAETKKKKS